MAGILYHIAFRFQFVNLLNMHEVILDCVENVLKTYTVYCA